MGCVLCAMKINIMIWTWRQPSHEHNCRLLFVVQKSSHFTLMQFQPVRKQKKNFCYNWRLMCIHYRNNVLVFCIIFDWLIFDSFYQLRLVWKSAEKSNEKLVNQKLCKTVKHCFNNEHSLPTHAKYHWQSICYWDNCTGCILHINDPDV